ncbi:zf-CCHC domain-containing protein [Tanacetum coccineum]
MSTQQDINAIRAQRLANTHDPLALMANTQTPFYPDHSSLITYIQHPYPNNNFVPQPSFNTNYLQHPMQNPEDISNSTTPLDMTLELMAKAFQLNNTTPTNNNQRIGNQFRQNAVQNVGHLVAQNAVQNQGIQNVGNHNGLSVISGIANRHGNGNVVAARAEGNGNGINGNPIKCYNCQGEGHYASNCTEKPRKRDVAYLQTQLQIAQKEEAGIQLNSKEFEFMAAAAAYDDIEEDNANCTLKDNLQQVMTSNNVYFIASFIPYYYSEDQYAVSIKEDTAYPCLHSPKTTENKAQYAVSRETQYTVFKIRNEYNILKDIKRGPYFKKSSIHRDLDNSTSNVLILLDSWTSGLLVYEFSLSVRMTKVIKGEFEKIKDVKVEDVPLTYDKPLEIFNNEVSRLSGMDDDLFTYKVEVANIPCDSKMDDDSEQEADDDMRPMKITRMIGSMNGTRTYHGSMRSHGLTPEFGQNPNQLNILASLSTIRLGVRNDQHVDYERYEALEDSELKDEGLRNKAIIEGFIKEDDDEPLHELPVWNIRRYMMIKYSFNDNNEYVAVKEDEYDDLTVTRKEACRAYQEIFQIMDEGWMVTKAE